MNTSLLHRSIAVLFFLFLLIAALYFAKGFLVPVVFGGLLAMLFLPLTKWFQKKGVHPVLSIIICILIFLVFVSGIVYLLYWQVGNLAEDTAKIQSQVERLISNLKNMISKKLGVSVAKQEEIINGQGSSGISSAGVQVVGILSYLGSFLVDFVLVIVYMFLFLFYRRHLKAFVYQVVSNRAKTTAQSALSDASQVGQQYLTGMSLMIFCLWVMYGIGFSLAGVKYALFFAILCGMLEIIPFVGNLTGTTITLLVSASQGASSSQLILILSIYLVIQFIQTYLLEPLIVGAKVNINPLFTILALVAGEMIWGIAGMVLAIPLLGIAKIICDHIEGLKPYGQLIGEIKQTRKRNAKT